MLHVQDIHTCVVFGSPPGLAPLTDFVKLDVSDEQSHKKSLVLVSSSILVTRKHDGAKIVLYHKSAM